MQICHKDKKQAAHRYSYSSEINATIVGNIPLKGDLGSYYYLKKDDSVVLERI